MKGKNSGIVYDGWFEFGDVIRQELKGPRQLRLRKLRLLFGYYLERIKHEITENQLQPC